MKIIATIGRDEKFITEATADELARIIGYSYTSSMPRPERGDRFTVGQEIPVNEMFQACQAISDMETTLKSITETHSRLVDNVKKFSSALHPAIQTIKAKQPK